LGGEGEADLGVAKFPMIMLAGIVAATAALAAGGERASGPQFLFNPEPRWREEPETSTVCAAVRAECPAFQGKSEIEADVGFDELYDASGTLVGLRLTRSTGCKPLDESALLGHRHFRLAFHHDGKPDLDDIHAELGPGVNPDAVRIVKRDGTSLSLGCD
jgi:hypothetical protein